MDVDANFRGIVSWDGGSVFKTAVGVKTQLIGDLTQVGCNSLSPNRLHLRSHKFAERTGNVLRVETGKVGAGGWGVGVP